jgi:sec-independent protein translocase protein TatA
VVAFDFIRTERQNMFGLREPSHWLLLILVVVLLFGAKRLPDSARALGRSLRIFKSEVKELNKEDKKSEEEGKGSN